MNTVVQDTLEDYAITVINDDQISENRIHSDETAKKFGFTGALVTGVSVYGYLTHPLVERYGEDWLSNTVADVIFRKPTYDGDDIIVRSEAEAEPSTIERHLVTCAYNADNTLLARLESYKPETMPAVDKRAGIAAAAIQPDREEISWDRIIIDQPVEGFTWQPSREDNQKYLDTQRDDIALYHLEDSPYLHPHYILSECNKTLMRIYALPAWIHTGTRMTMRRALRVGDSIEVRAIPIKKWENKGHEFITLYIAMYVDDEVAFEAEHTAIYKIAD